MPSQFKTAENLYFRGDYNSAFQVCTEVASKGDIKCTRLLGWMYFRGKGCERNDSKALTCFSDASAAGDAEAEFGIAAIKYEQEEYRQARLHLEEALKRGFVPAGRWLGVLNHLGLGAKRDLVKARMYYREAADKGNLPAYLQYALMLKSGAEGFSGRVRAIPMLIKFVISSFLEAWTDQHSQRLM